MSVVSYVQVWNKHNFKNILNPYKTYYRNRRGEIQKDK